MATLGSITSVMPADYVLRAIPLQAGDHRIRLEYRPIAFVIGKWTSLVAWLMFGVAASVCLARDRRLAGMSPTGNSVVIQN